MKKSNAFSPLLCAIALAVIAAPIAAQAQVKSTFKFSGLKGGTPYTITMFPNAGATPVYTHYPLGPNAGEEMRVDLKGTALLELPYANYEPIQLYATLSPAGTTVPINRNLPDDVPPSAPEISYQATTNTITAVLRGEYNFNNLPWYCTDVGTGQDLFRVKATKDEKPYELNPVTEEMVLSSPLLYGQVLKCVSTDKRDEINKINLSEVTPFVLPVKLATPAATANGATTRIEGMGSPGVDLQVLNAEGIVLATTTIAADGSYSVDVETPAKPEQAKVKAINLATAKNLPASDPSFSSIYAEQKVSIGTAATNDAPVGKADSYSTPVNTAFTVAAPGVLTNDTAPEGRTLSAAVATQPTNGSVTLNADGSFTYTPNDKFEGADSFTYLASYDSSKTARAGNTKAAPFVDSAPVTVTINVTAGSTTTQAVPTLGHAGLALLTGLMMGAGILRRRQQSKDKQHRQ